MIAVPLECMGYVRMNEHVCVLSGSGRCLVLHRQMWCVQAPHGWALPLVVVLDRSLEWTGLVRALAEMLKLALLPTAQRRACMFAQYYRHNRQSISNHTNIQQGSVALLSDDGYWLPL